MNTPILLIDDEEKFAQMLKELLQLNGYESDYCLNPEEALIRLRQEDFDLVITDYKMPEMDGAEFLMEARKVNPDLPVIMISGLMNMPELIKVANIGVTLVLEKPFKTEELIDQVARFVRTSPADEASVDAMDMEASEINFQAGHVNVTYPTPAKFLADKSNENRRFLESIWKQANASRHLPFYAQRGAEIHMVAREIMDWTDHDQDNEVVRIDLLDTQTDFTRNWIIENDEFPGVLVVDIRESSWNDEAVRLLSEWITFIESSGKDLSMARILYALPTGAQFDPDALDLSSEHRGLLSSDYPVLLALRDRVLDVAEYLSRLFTDEEKRRLGEENSIRLIHYSWPGGYKELQSRVNKLKAYLKTGGRLPPEIFNSVLSERSEDPVSLNGTTDLEGYLKRRQREYILLHRESGEELKDTLLRLGIDDAPASPQAILKDEILVYPDLLSESAS